MHQAEHKIYIFLISNFPAAGLPGIRMGAPQAAGHQDIRPAVHQDIRLAELLDIQLAELLDIRQGPPAEGLPGIQPAVLQVVGIRLAGHQDIRRKERRARPGRLMVGPLDIRTFCML